MSSPQSLSQSKHEEEQWEIEGRDRGQEAATEGEEEEEEDEEPRLKYTRLTRPLGGVYRNGDAVSTSLVFGERMVCMILAMFPN